jgi:hypothetical protein
MDPKDQPQFNPKIPISEVLKQEQRGFVPSAPKLSDVVNTIGNMYDSTKDLGAANTLPKTPSANTVPPTGQVSAGGITPPPANKIKIIKTYSSDAAEAIKMQEQASVAKIAIAQEEQRREQGEEIGAEPKSKKGFWLLLLVIVLVVLGAAAVPTVQYILNQKKQAVPVSVEKTIIPFDHQETLTLDNATRVDFLGAINVLATKPPTNSTIEYIKVLENIQDVNKKTVTQEIAPDVFANIIGPNIPSALARSFDSDYMYGIEDISNPKPFIIFKTSSYQQTFANMLRWETKMISDLSPILNLGTDVAGRSFTDQVIINKDVRAVTAPDGTILFLYGFLDNQTLIITTNSKTFQDLNSSYVASRFVQ